MDVKEVLLPGIGLRYEFTCRGGDRIGIIAWRSGDFEMVRYAHDDPDQARPLLRLSDDEADAVAQILGAPRIAERFTELTREVPGIDTGQVQIPPASPFVDRPLGETRARTRTGAAIVAIVRGEQVIASPGPAELLHAVAGMAAAVTALGAAFAASYRWGHQVGRLVTHPDSEQLLLRVLGITLIVAAVAESVHASAAVGVFLVGLTLTGDTADRARKVLGPLRDLFAAIFFLAIGLAVDPQRLLPMLPAAVALAGVTAATKVMTGVYAARREGVAWRGQLRAGTTLVARGEFSLIIIGLVGSTIPGITALATSYVFVVAIVGPLLARVTGGPLPVTAGR